MGRWENGRPGNEGWPVAGGTASEGWRTLFDGGKAGAGIVRGEMAGGERNWGPEIAMREDTHLSASPHLGCGSNNEVRIAGGVGDGIMT